MPREHVPDTCNTKRGEDCDCQGYYCKGGLTYCLVCYGVEGSLPTVCPGRKMSKDVQDQVYAAKADYREVPTLTGTTCRWIWAKKHKTLEPVPLDKEKTFIIKSINNYG